MVSTTIQDAVQTAKRTMGFDESSTEQASPDAVRKMNIGSTERNISIAAGTAMALLTLTKPLSTRGIVSAVIGGALLHRGLSGYCSLYKALGISTRPKSAGASAETEAYFEKGVHIEHSLTINKSPQELYDFWHNFENLPRFMDHLKSVTVLENGKSHWIARGPLNYSVEWDAEIINDVPGKLIAWQSIGASEIDNAGTVRFEKSGTDDSATLVRVVISYIPPAGKAGDLVAKLLGSDPKTEIKKDLKKLKQLLEAGELATNANGTPRGVCAR